MKRLVIFISALLLALIPLQDSLAMQLHQKKEKPTTITRYFNVPHFTAKLAAIFYDQKDESDSEADSGSEKESPRDTIDSKEELTKEAVLAVLSSLRFGNFPIKIKRGSKTVKAKNYINVKTFKALLESIVNDYFDNVEASNANTVRYLTALRKCLKIKAIQKDFSDANIDIEASLANAIAYCTNNKEISIEKCISLEKVAEFLGFKLETVCQVKELKQVINALLKKEKLTKNDIFGCLKLAAFLKYLDFSNNDILKLEPAIPGLLSLAIDYANKKPQATDALLKFFKNYPPKKKKKKLIVESSASSDNEEQSSQEERVKSRKKSVKKMQNAKKKSIIIENSSSSDSEVQSSSEESLKPQKKPIPKKKAAKKKSIVIENDEQSDDDEREIRKSVAAAKKMLKR